MLEIIPGHGLRLIAEGRDIGKGTALPPAARSLLEQMIDGKHGLAETPMRHKHDKTTRLKRPVDIRITRPVRNDDVRHVRHINKISLPAEKPAPCPENACKNARLPPETPENFLKTPQIRPGVPRRPDGSPRTRPRAPAFPSRRAPALNSEHEPRPKIRIPRSPGRSQQSGRSLRTNPAPRLSLRCLFPLSAVPRPPNQHRPRPPTPRRLSPNAPPRSGLSFPTHPALNSEHEPRPKIRIPRSPGRSQQSGRSLRTNPAPRLSLRCLFPLSAVPRPPNQHRPRPPTPRRLSPNAPPRSGLSFPTRPRAQLRTRAAPQNPHPPQSRPIAAVRPLDAPPALRRSAETRFVPAREKTGPRNPRAPAGLISAMSGQRRRRVPSPPFPGTCRYACPAIPGPLPCRAV